MLNYFLATSMLFLKSRNDFTKKVALNLEESINVNQTKQRGNAFSHHAPFVSSCCTMPLLMGDLQAKQVPAGTN